LVTSPLLRTRLSPALEPGHGQSAAGDPGRRHPADEVAAALGPGGDHERPGPEQQPVPLGAETVDLLEDESGGGDVGELPGHGDSGCGVLGMQSPVAPPYRVGAGGTSQVTGYTPCWGLRCVLN